MILGANKKIVLLGLSFILVGSTSLFANYFNFLNKKTEPISTKNTFPNFSSKSSLGTYMSLFDKSFDTHAFNKALEIKTDKDTINKDDHISFLKLNPSLLDKQIKSFVFNKISENNQKLMINSEQINGKIFYSCLSENSIDVLVKWKNNKYHGATTFYDNFSIILNY